RYKRIGYGEVQEMSGRDELDDVRFQYSARDHLIRRFIHLFSGITVVYYLLPESVFYLPAKFWLIFLFGFVPFMIEFLRARRGGLFLGQRGHEEGRIGSWAWAIWTSGAIMLVLPQEIAIPVIVIYSVADPVIGEIRLWRKWLVWPIGGAFTLVMFIAFGYPIYLGIFAAFFMVIGEALEIVGTIRLRPELFRLYRNAPFVEYIKIPFKTDDNATTQLVPALALGLVYLFYPSIFPGPWLYPVV
ncbi:MAG: hypothetical protein ACMUIE_02255, partial [Thermoplasmatota archaeon]